YDISAGANNNVKTKLAIAPLKTPGPVRPSGMAFSPDSSRVSLLFEENGNGLLVVYSVGGGRLVLQFQRSYPPMPVKAPSQWEGTSITWVGKNAILLYGQ